MGVEYLGISEEELEEFARTMEGSFKEETIEDFKRLCKMDLYLIE